MTQVAGGATTGQSDAQQTGKDWHLLTLWRSMAEACMNSDALSPMVCFQTWGSQATSLARPSRVAFDGNHTWSMGPADWASSAGESHADVY